MTISVEGQISYCSIFIIIIFLELLFYADNIFLLDITCRDETLFKHSRVKVLRFTKYTLHILKQVEGALWLFWGEMMWI